MPKTKKSLTAKLDKLCSQLTRAFGRCEKCGRTENLQTHHVYGRANRRLRWEPRNLVCLCPACHLQWAEANPLDFVDWFDNYRITDGEWLREENAKGIRKWTIDEMEEHAEFLKKEIDRQP